MTKRLFHIIISLLLYVAGFYMLTTSIGGFAAWGVFLLLTANRIETMNR